MKSFQKRNKKLFVKAVWLGFVFAICFSRILNVLADGLNFTNELDKAYEADKQTNFEQSIVHYTQALQIQTNRPHSAIAYLSRGRAYLKTKQFDKAERDFNEAVLRAPDREFLRDAYYLRGLFQQEMTNYQESLNDFTKAIRLKPDFQPAYVCRAKSQLAQSNFDFCISDCNLAILLNTNDVAAYFYKGAAYKFQQDYDKEIEALTQAIKLATNLTSFAPVFLDRAYAFTVKEDFTNAIADYGMVVQLDPANVDAYVGRGLFLSGQGDFASGMADSEKAIQLDSNCFTAYNNLAWMLATATETKLRDGKKAVEFATRACELSKWKEPYCLGTLAAAFAETGKFDEAIKWEEKCIQMGLPNEKDMVQARHELELFKQGKPYDADK